VYSEFARRRLLGPNLVEQADLGRHNLKPAL
jgi:hypothetical protein